MKAVLHFRASAAFRARLLDRAPRWLNIAFVDEADEAALRSEMATAEVLLHVLTPVTAAMIVCW